MMRDPRARRPSDETARVHAFLTASTCREIVTCANLPPMGTLAYSVACVETLLIASESRCFLLSVLCTV
eukprot:9471944-Pyramimonas_sp.AAC.1